MDDRIIVDSCCDLTPELAEKLRADTVSLTLMLGEQEYRDDENLDLPDFMVKMKNCTERVGSAAPAPGEYASAFINAGRAFAVTLSSKLSGSYASAKTGQEMAREAGVNDVYVFDSKSAASAEVLIAIRIRELLDQELGMKEIISKVEHFISEMKTYFVLENHDNLVKNGRMSKLADRLLGALNIRLIMGADENGQIALYSKARGEKKMLERLVSLIGDSGRKTEESNLVISHCNNESMAQKLCDAVKKSFRFKNIFIVPTRGISSLYADDKGIIMAF